MPNNTDVKKNNGIIKPKNAKLNSNRPERITAQINNANVLNSEVYIKRVKKASQPSKSKIIKRPKKKKHIRMSLAAILMAGSTLTGIIVGEEIGSFKNEQAERSLAVLKEEIGADKIYNNSTMLSSNSSKAEYGVIKDGKTYRYLAYNNDGSIKVIENSIGDEELINAISIVTNADGGTIFDAINAKKVADEIEGGKKLKMKMDKGKDIEEEFEIE